jgi:DNA replication licensing factor MCM6
LGDEDDEMGNPFDNNNNNRNGNRGARGGVAGTRDAMSEDDGIPGSQAEEDGMNSGARGGAAKGRRARMNLDVPPVRDATGEKVMESFEVFLKTWVFVDIIHFLLIVNLQVYRVCYPS